MKLRFTVSLSLTREKPETTEEKFEHRDVESLAELAETPRVGFVIPTTGDE